MFPSESLLKRSMWTQKNSSLNMSHIICQTWTLGLSPWSEYENIFNQWLRAYSTQSFSYAFFHFQSLPLFTLGHTLSKTLFFFCFVKHKRNLPLSKWDVLWCSEQSVGVLSGARGSYQMWMKAFGVTPGASCSSSHVMMAEKTQWSVELRHSSFYPEQLTRYSHLDHRN